VQGEQHEDAVLVCGETCCNPCCWWWTGRIGSRCRGRDGWLEKLIQMQNDREKYLLIVSDPHDQSCCASTSRLGEVAAARERLGGGVEQQE
jgi:hypothetical protein